MPTNKPQNLEELIEKIIRKWNVEDIEFEEALREIAKATCDAVRVEVEVTPHGHRKEYRDCVYCAVKAQEDKVKEWLGEGGGN